MWQASFCWLPSLYAGNLAGAAHKGSPFPPCHSAERSDEESRGQNTVRSHTGSFADAQDDSIFFAQHTGDL